MDKQTLQQKVAHLSIIVKRLMKSTFSGDFTAAFKGAGLEFAQLRSYSMGDDVRAIDWKSSAKMNKLMVKEFIQEKERTILIYLDATQSMYASSQEELKAECAAQCAAIFALIGASTGDRVGLVVDTEKGIYVLLPRKGRAHVGSIVDMCISSAFEKYSIFYPRDIKTVVAQFITSRYKNALFFLISDWIKKEDELSSLLGIVGSHFETIAVRVSDPLEVRMPDVGMLQTFDPVSGMLALVDTRSHSKTNINAALQKRRNDQARFLRSCSIGTMDIIVGQSLIRQLTSFFYKRAH